MPSSAPPDPDEIRHGYQQNFDEFNDVLVGTKYSRYLRFFNFGYAVLEGETRRGPKLPPFFPNKDSAQLLFNVVGDTPLTGATVLEVGCGRGGNLGLLLEHYGIARAIGTDIAYSSMAYCHEAYTDENACFFQANAEQLAVASSSVDAVVNIESSGCYPDLESFYRDVVRVLRPGGMFLYADLMEREILSRSREVLQSLGLELVSERDITPNVSASRAARADRQLLAFGDGKQTSGFRDREWVGADGSELNDKLTGGEGVYQILRLRKRDSTTAPHERLFTDAERQRIRKNAWDGVEILRRTSPAAT